MLARLQKKNANIQDVFKILLLTNTGKFIYERFLKEYLKKKIKFCHYPQETIDKLNSIKSEEPNGACFVTDGQTGVIYFDPNCEAIILSIYFIHEMTHSLDQNLWLLAQYPENFNSENTNEIKIQSEYSSYRNQFRFLNELDKIIPGTTDYLEKNYPLMKILKNEFNNEHSIKDHYQFKIAS